jgi:predicted ferric reductase
VSIRSAGDYTTELHEKLHPGTPAKATGPFGGFDYHGGGQQQLWIAGGIGVTPFMSWIRALDDAFERTVHFFYSVGQESDAIYLEEIASAHDKHVSFEPHVMFSDRDGQLTAQQVVTDSSLGSDAWVYMCGPPAMMKAFSQGFRKLGLPPNQVRWEQFNIR